MTGQPELAEAALLVLGKIVSVHGVRGAIKVYSETDPIDNILDYPDWILRRGDEVRHVSVVSARVQGRILVVQLKGLTDRDAALAMAGFEICVPRTELPELESGEYYWYQLVGLQVMTLEGQLLGRIDHLLETGANDVMVVKPCAGSIDQRERLLPYLPDLYIKHIDLTTGVMQVDWDAEF